jgi:hypothetical protein
MVGVMLAGPALNYLDYGGQITCCSNSTGKGDPDTTTPRLYV